MMARPVVHFEIGCRDKPKSREFFQKLFDWEIDDGPAGTIAAAAGGIAGHMTSLGHEPHNYVTVYVEVDALEPYLERAKELGGRIVVPPVRLPTGSFAWFSDPDGNLLGLWKNG
jgi:predicted enzyme related to lactoylglutathione lyase